MLEFSDEDILAMLRSMDRHRRNKALGFVYDAFYPSIGRYVLRNNGNSADARDLFQEGVIVLYEKAVDDQFELTGSIQGFLLTVCRNLWLKRLRKSKRKVDWDQVDTGKLGRSGMLDDLVPDRKHKAQHLLGQLGEQCKRLLVMYYFRRLDMAQIAEAMNLANAGVAKNKKARCMKKLKELAAQMSKES